jgi:beta-lactamase regulating signal transducer with metallopeptidase domain
MISIMIKSAIVLAVAACISSALRRQSAALRHAIWTAGLIGALVVPLCSITLPPWQNGFVGWAESIFHTGNEETSIPASNVVVPTKSAAISSSKTAPTAPPRTATDAATHSWTASQIAVAIWIGGAAIGLLFMLLGALRLAWVAIRSEPVTDPRWIEMAERVRRSLGFRRPVRLLQNPSGHFLGTWGILVPRVLLPSSVNQWSDDRAWMVLGHELAHIKRHDWVVQVLAEAARAIYWFNPVFWLAYGRLRRESEHACDDAVIRMGAAGTQYAEELLELARALRSENSMRSPILAMAQPSHLERRLVALLDPALNRLAATPWSVIVVALVAIGLTLPLAAVRAPDPARSTASVLPASAPVSPPPASPEPEKSSAKSDDAGKRNIATPTPASQSAGKQEVPETAQAPIQVQPEYPITSSSNVAPISISKLIGPSVAEPRVASPPPIECKVSPAIQETKMKETKSALGSGPWHINDDRTIWAWDQPYIAGAAVNTMWMKPANVDLVITGRRLDGESAPLRIQLAKDSTAGYIATAMTFPKAGCWEVTATAGSSTLTYITRVDPQ